MAPVAERTFEAIRSEPDGAVYPREILGECRDALVLFAAGFHGRQDAFWIADAGLEALCVDIRGDLLSEMSAVYPGGWAFIEDDVYDFLPTAPTADLVSVDCPSGHFQRCADLVDLLCGLARRYVVLGCGRDTEILTPGGWELLERRYRSHFAGGTYWAVLKKDKL